MEKAARDTFPYAWTGCGEPPTASPWGERGRSATLGAVAAFCNFVLGVLNTPTVPVQEHKQFIQAVLNRPPGQGLLTVSNHMSVMDDPGLFSALLPLKFFLTEHEHHQTRWVLCANDVCHKNKFLRDFFLSGKALPVVRGAGTEQPIMRATAGRLADGDWVHIFPEGRVNQDGELAALKLGAAYLLCKAAESGGKPPLVLPLYHVGMEQVKPLKTVLPRVGNEVHISVGQPVRVDDLLKRCSKKSEDQVRLYKEITIRIDTALKHLQGVTRERRAAAGGVAAAATTATAGGRT